LPVVAILAHKRHRELDAVLRALRRSPGGSEGRIIVFQDGNHTGVQRIAASHGAEAVFLDSECYRYRVGRGGGGGGGARDESVAGEPGCVRNVYPDATGNRVSHNYWNMLGYLFTPPTTPSGVPGGGLGLASAVILEEDLLPSPDAWSYFQQGALVSSKDPSLFVVSAWNTMGHTPFAHDESITMRDQRWMPLGWLATRRSYEAVLATPTCWRLDEASPGVELALGWWDEPWYCTQHKLGQETLYPEVPRVHHLFLAPGWTTSLARQQHWLDPMALSTGGTPLVMLPHAAYEASLGELITHAR